MSLRAPKQRSMSSPKSLNACSNSQWLILHKRYCDKDNGEYSGPKLALVHNNRPIELLSISPLEESVLCRKWQVCVMEKISGERWCITITPSSVEAAPLRELISA